MLDGWTKVLQQLPNQVDECQIKLMGKLKGASAPYDIGINSSVDKKYFKAKNEVGFKQ